MKTIKFVKVPGATTEINVEDNATLGQALDVYKETSGQNIDGFETRIGDSVAAMTVVPANGTKVFLVQQVKGRK